MSYPHYIPQKYRPTEIALPQDTASDDVERSEIQYSDAAFHNLRLALMLSHCDAAFDSNELLKIKLQSEKKWKDKYDENPPDCADLKSDDNFPEESKRSVNTRLAEVGGIEAERQLNLMASARLGQRLSEIDGSTPEFASDFEILLNLRVNDRLQEDLSEAALPHLEQIRRNLIAIAVHSLRANCSDSRTLPFRVDMDGCEDGGTYLPSNDPEIVKRLGDRLFIDLSAEPGQQTTQLSFTISRLHTFVQSARLGKLDGVTTEALDPDIWAYLRSYGTFHAAQTVASYPENFLFPDVRRGATEQFEKALGASDASPTLSKTTYFKELKHIENLHFIRSFIAEGNTFIFAKSSVNSG